MKLRLAFFPNLLFRAFVRLSVNTFGIWIAARLIPTVTSDDEFTSYLAAGIVLSIVNMLIKPIVVIFSLPAIVFSLGIFMIFVNGLMVYFAAGLVDSFDVETFGGAILAGVVIGLVNYAVTTLLEERLERIDD